MGRLLLIPWHIGDMRDLSVSAVETSRRLRVFVAEEPDRSRSDLVSLSVDCAGKEFWLLPDGPDEALLVRVMKCLETQDVGVLSSGGMPCFIDPGAWLVRQIRRAGRPVAALGGPSAVAAVLGLSGTDLREGHGRATLVYPLVGPGGRLDRTQIIEAALRDTEPVIFFPNVDRFEDCVEVLAEKARGRWLTVFYDLTKAPGTRYPHANETVSMLCEEWRRRTAQTASSGATEIAMVLHPKGILP